MTETTTVEQPESLKDQKKRLDIQVRQQELWLKEAELVKARAEAEKAQEELVARRIDVDARRRLEERRKATQDYQDLTYRFAGDVDPSSSLIFTNWLTEVRLRRPNDRLTVYIDSPGGSVYDGFVIMDALKEATDAGVHVTAKVTGMAASMAGFILQAASERLIGKHSWLMLHAITTFQFGASKAFEVQDKDEYLKRLTRKGLEAYADRSGGKWTVDALMEKMYSERKDWWLTAEEALAEGFIDGVF